MAAIKLLHVITTLDTGGAEKTLYKLLSRLNRERFWCEVISLTTNGPVGAQVQALGVQV